MPATSPPIQERFFRAAIIRSLDKDPDQLDRAVAAMWLRSQNGDVAAFSAIRDTLDGKPTQEITGANGGPISLQFSINYEASDRAKVIDHEPTMALEPRQEGQESPPDGG